MTEKNNSLTSVKLYYGKDGDESVKHKHFGGFRRGGAEGAQKKVSHNMLN